MTFERVFAINYYSLAFFASPTKRPERKSLLHKLQDTNQAGYLMGHYSYIQGRLFFSGSILDVGC